MQFYTLSVTFCLQNWALEKQQLDKYRAPNCITKRLTSSTPPPSRVENIRVWCEAKNVDIYISLPPLNGATAGNVLVEQLA